MRPTNHERIRPRLFHDSTIPLRNTEENIGPRTIFMNKSRSECKNPNLFSSIWSEPNFGDHINAQRKIAFRW